MSYRGHTTITWCYITLLLVTIITADTSVCSTDDTNCDCSLNLERKNIMTCHRMELARVPVLTENVYELDMFKVTLTESVLKSESLRSANKIEIIRMISSDLSSINYNSFQGLYSLHSLSLSDNKLVNIPKFVFSDLNLLQNLDLSSNSLTNLSSQVFYNLRNLNTLDLSYNTLEVLPADLFVYLPSLKTLRLKNSLKGITTLAPTLLAHNPLLRTLNLENNGLEHIHTDFFGSTTNLRSLNLKKNRLTTIAESTMSGLTQLVTIDMDGNPFSCDCMMGGYRRWIDSMSSNNWAPLHTGRCSQPSELQGQYISTLPMIKFTCTTTSTTVKTTTGKLSSTSLGTNHTIKVPVIVDPLDKTTPESETTVTKSTAMTTTLQTRSLERSLIIGGSIGGAILFIIANVLIICCVRHRKSGSQKIKYIIKPEDFKLQCEPEESFDSFKQPVINNSSTGRGYIISGDNSGFYHTGSRSRLDSCDTDVFDTATTGLDSLSRQQLKAVSADSVNPKLNGPSDSVQSNYISINHIRTPSTNHEEKNYQEVLASYYGEKDPMHHVDAHYEFDMTAPSAEKPFPTIYMNDSHLDQSRPIYSLDINQSYPFHDIGQLSLPRTTAVHRPYAGFYDDKAGSDTVSRDLVLHELNGGIKYSTGSADSGVNSNSPCPISDVLLSPNNAGLTPACLDESQSKKVRNETYV